MKKECNVVMLTTDKKSKIWTGIEKPLKCYEYEQHAGSPGQAYHLHIISNEEIKEGDWYFSIIGREIRKATKEDVHQIKVSNKSGFDPVRFKIIATTDTSLFITRKESYEAYNIDLPQISQSFINTFIEEYNKGNVIEKVMVKYEEGKIEHPLLEPFPNNSSYADELGHWNRLKVNPDNTINISLIEEEKKYSRSEVEIIIKKHSEYISKNIDYDGIINACCPINYPQWNDENWIKENLK